MGNGEWGIRNREYLFYTNAQCPMPNAQCPMPYDPLPIPHSLITRPQHIADDIKSVINRTHDFQNIID